MGGDFLDELDAQLADDEYARLRNRLAHNDDQMLEDLVTLRRTKGLSQDEVASRMNRSKTAVSNFERLGADPHLSTIRRYAAAIGALLETKVRDYDIFRHDLTPIEIVYRHMPKSPSVTENEQILWAVASPCADDSMRLVVHAK
ncbi:helix-turn-helix domain-containing protein [Prescottella equi]|uniref:helix-turn-helix domain-containing protein n=1 Tax=Rhodococcus hoagii TaxID=43767 RepID=UPI001C755B63|nr:helix-turn-helix transcriptional regulator [Prescottella equi]BCN82792.1 hypothetical protein RE0356_14330 [Prescottella equi]